MKYFKKKLFFQENKSFLFEQVPQKHYIMPNETQFDNIYPGHDILRCMPLGKRQSLCHHEIKWNQQLEICVKSFIIDLYNKTFFL